MRLLRALIAVAYPFLIFLGLRWLEPRWVALWLGAAVVLRAMLRSHRPSADEVRHLAVPGLLVAAVLGSTLVLNDARLLLFVPVLVNGALLAAFARSLIHGPPLVEIFARLQSGDLSEAQVRYCRTVTGIWSAFFAANGAACFALAWWGDLWLWTLYTGLVSYLFVGALYAGEFAVRSWRFRNYQGTLVEPLFRRIFPQGPRA
jgi:uncharacterized membrane protein